MEIGTKAHFKYMQRCNECRLNTKCVFMKYAQYPHTADYKKVRDVACSGCPCYSAYSKCYRSLNMGCKNFQLKK